MKEETDEIDYSAYFALTNYLKPPFPDMSYLTTDVPVFGRKKLKYNVKGEIRTTPKIGRNEDCPCGSGKKYKKCCETK